jgi:hypothetical protein
MQIFDDFEMLSSDEDVLGFVTKYGMADIGTPPNTQILGHYRGVYNGASVEVIHRWYDPSGPFSIQPDIHKAKLEVAGYPPREISYQG